MGKNEGRGLRGGSQRDHVPLSCTEPVVVSQGSVTREGPVSLTYKRLTYEKEYSRLSSFLILFFRYRWVGDRGHQCRLCFESGRGIGLVTFRTNGDKDNRLCDPFRRVFCTVS